MPDMPAAFNFADLAQPTGTKYQGAISTDETHELFPSNCSAGVVTSRGCPQ